MEDFYQVRAISVLRILVEAVATMGTVGLALALIGLYGLIAFSVARRTREIGIRMAIGAHRSDVLRMVLRQGLTLAVAGIGIGGAISVAVARALTAGLVGLGHPNAATYVIVPVTLLVVAMASCYLPALRASRVDPMVALRYE
jgi:ABC-type antimicrobial peptide transport system permease subunit